MKRRINVGLLVTNLEENFTNHICKGAIQAAEELDVNLFILPGKYIGINADSDQREQVKYDYQQNMLFYLGKSSSLDILAGNIVSTGIWSDEERKKKLLSIYDGKVLLTIASKEESYPSVLYDNKSGLQEALQYLIVEEKRKHICMVSAPPSIHDAKERTEVFCETLQKHGFMVEDKQITYGDLTLESTGAVEKLLDQNPEVDAICCVNDQTAMAAYTVLKRCGIKIGEDIAVIGFDDVEQAEKCIPPLATVRAPAKELGYQAVMQAVKIYDTGINKTKPIETKFILRQSACRKKLPLLKPIEESPVEVLKKQVQELSELHRITNTISRDMLMFETKNEEEIYASMLRPLHQIDICSSRLYVYKEPMAYCDGEDWKNPETVFLKAYQKGKDVLYIPNKYQEIKTDDIFENDKYDSERRHTYVAIDLYSNEMQYGILLCNLQYKFFHFAEFITYQLSASLKIMHLLEQQKRNLEKLDAISKRDELTGIYNRRGFYSKVDLFLEKHMDNYIYVIYADLDQLKMINDEYGHKEGDYAIANCGRILAELINPLGVTGRIGGDEFAAVALYDAEDFEAQLRVEIGKKLKEINRISKKPYRIDMSLGIHRQVYGRKKNLDELLKLADEKLYHEKRCKRESRGRHLEGGII